MKRIVVLISGNGSNLQALIDQQQRGEGSWAICRVISNRQNAFGLTRAGQAGIPTSTLSLAAFKREHRGGGGGGEEGRAHFDRELARIIVKEEPQLVVCAGWMHILSAAFLDALAGIRIINLHPALPGQFNGAGAIRWAYDAWQRGECQQTGVMVHDVIALVDMGAPVLVRPVPFHPGDTLDQLEERIHLAEHAALVEAVEQIVHTL